jgi:hypothetical protein
MNDQDFYDSIDTALATKTHNRAAILLGYMWAHRDMQVDDTEDWWKLEVVTLLWAMSISGCFDGGAE